LTAYSSFPATLPCGALPFFIAVQRLMSQPALQLKKDIGNNCRDNHRQNRERIAEVPVQLGHLITVRYDGPVFVLERRQQVDPDGVVRDAAIRPDQLLIEAGATQKPDGEDGVTPFAKTMKPVKAGVRAIDQQNHRRPQ
jgi:hypothetical protein